MEKKEESTNSFLTFKLGEEEFGAHVSQVLNILDMTKITDVPKSPDYMKGVINLRGTVLPVIDTRIKFSMSETEHSTNTCIIVLDLELDGEPVNIGAIVDEVVSVVDIEESQVEPPPSIGNKYKSEFITGMAKIEDRFVMLLDMQKVLNEQEKVDIANASKINETTEA